MARKRLKTGAGAADSTESSVDAALEWFMRLQEDHSSETLKAFESWEKADPANGRAYGDLVRMTSMPSLHKATAGDRSRRISTVPITCKPRLSRWKIGSTVAASLLAGIFWFQLPTIMVQWRADYMSEAGQRQTVTLPDGSTVLLNTLSAIAIDFADGRRRVSLLDGEAFFDVKHDPAHPFVVTAHFSALEVKGTAFGVAVSKQQDTVVLERGQVEVTGTKARTSKAKLEPGQMVIATVNGLSGISSVDPAQSLAWRDGRLVFHDRPFSGALSDLKRYYDGQIVVATNRFADTLVSGNYRIDDPDAAIRTFAMSVGAEITHLPGRILILR
jgi:transmembrane sensor